MRDFSSTACFFYLISKRDGTASYTINNGDLIALNKIKDQYDLEDSDDVITFAIGVLSNANGGVVSVTGGIVLTLIGNLIIEILRKP